MLRHYQAGYTVQAGGRDELPRLSYYDRLRRVVGISLCVGVEITTPTAIWICQQKESDQRAFATAVSTVSPSCSRGFQGVAALLMTWLCG